MTKAELVAKIAEGAGITKAQADKALVEVVEAVLDELKAGRAIAITGLGSFSLSERSARKGRNPKTGEEIDIPASRGVKFKPSKNVKDMVN